MWITLNCGVAEMCYANKVDWLNKICGKASESMPIATTSVQSDWTRASSEDISASKCKSGGDVLPKKLAGANCSKRPFCEVSGSDGPNTNTQQMCTNSHFWKALQKNVKHPCCYLLRITMLKGHIGLVLVRGFFLSFFGSCQRWKRTYPSLLL